ncbi:MAG TPA: zinc ribbon domain-containing protein, partial [Polyangiaceae bacterium]|nr:zinc ribbon domain-containing protein [Polyangiaceae bacterium]
ACGHAWEAEQSISAPPLKSCPKCQQETAKRQVSGGAGFILKGGGWYADLYGSPKSSKSAEKSEKGASSSGDTKKDSGSKDSGSKDSGSKDSGSKSEASGGSASEGSKGGKSESAPSAS